MEHHKRDQATLALIAALVFFFNLGGVGLWDEDEPKNAACGLEMLARGDWVTPSFNHELRTDKPILLYWLMLTSYQIFGVNEFAARFFSAVCGVGTVLLTYRLGRLLFTPRVGWWAGVILCTAMMFTVLARAVTPDSTLIFFTTLSLYVFVHGATLTENRRTANASEDGETKTAWTNWTPDRWWIWAAMYAIMGFAVLAKGPVGFLLPTTVLGVYLLARGWMESPSIISESSGRLAKIAGFFAWFLGPRRVAGVAWTLRPLTAILAVGLIALPWYVLVGMQTEGAWLAGFLGKHNVGRFLQPMENHRGPIFFYMLATMVGFFPWSVFLPASVVQLFRRMNKESWTRGDLFVLCWIAVYFVFFSLAATKLPNYIVPIFPALALVAAAFLCRCHEEPATTWWFRTGLCVWAAIGVGILIGLPIAAHFLLDGKLYIGALGLIPMAGGFLAWKASHRLDHQRALATVAASCVCFIVSAMGLVAGQVSEHQNAPYFASLIEQNGGDASKLATYDYFAPSLVFYSGQRVDQLINLEEVDAFVAENERPFILTREERVDQLIQAMPADVKVLGRQKRFLRRHDLVLLGRVATPLTAGRDSSGARK